MTDFNLTPLSNLQVLHLAVLEEVPSREVGGGSSADGNLTLECTTTKLSQQTRYTWCQIDGGLCESKHHKGYLFGFISLTYLNLSKQIPTVSPTAF